MRGDDDENEESTVGQQRYPVMPSLVALQQMRNRLNLAHLGKKLMKWTAVATGKELRIIAQELVRQMEDYEDEVADAFLLLSRARYFYPNLNIKVLENVSDTPAVWIEKTTRNTAGVKLSIFNIADENVDPYTHLGIERGGETILEAKIVWRHLLRSMIYICELRESFRDLDIANKNATKKQNCLQKIIIPKTILAIAYIQTELEEMEREENYRLKLFKKNADKKNTKQKYILVSNETLKELSEESIKEATEEQGDTRSNIDMELKTPELPFVPDAEITPYTDIKERVSENTLWPTMIKLNETIKCTCANKLCCGLCSLATQSLNTDQVYNRGESCQTNLEVIGSEQYMEVLMAHIDEIIRISCDNDNDDFFFSRTVSDNLEHVPCALDSYSKVIPYKPPENKETAYTPPVLELPKSSSSSLSTCIKSLKGDATSYENKINSVLQGNNSTSQTATTDLCSCASSKSSYGIHFCGSYQSLYHTRDFNERHDLPKRLYYVGRRQSAFSNSPSRSTIKTRGSRSERFYSSKFTVITTARILNYPENDVQNEIRSTCTVSEPLFNCHNSVQPKSRDHYTIYMAAATRQKQAHAMEEKCRKCGNKIADPSSSHFTEDASCYFNAATLNNNHHKPCTHKSKSIYSRAYAAIKKCAHRWVPQLTGQEEHGTSPCCISVTSITAKESEDAGLRGSETQDAGRVPYAQEREPEPLGSIDKNTMSQYIALVSHQYSPFTPYQPGLYDSTATGYQFDVAPCNYRNINCVYSEKSKSDLSDISLINDKESISSVNISELSLTPLSLQTQGPLDEQLETSDPLQVADAHDKAIVDTFINPTDVPKILQKYILGPEKDTNTYSNLYKKYRINNTNVSITYVTLIPELNTPFGFPKKSNSNCVSDKAETSEMAKTREEKPCQLCSAMEYTINDITGPCSSGKIWGECQDSCNQEERVTAVKSHMIPEAMEPVKQEDIPKNYSASETCNTINDQATQEPLPRKELGSFIFLPESVNLKLCGSVVTSENKTKSPSICASCNVTDNRLVTIGKRNSWPFRTCATKQTSFVLAQPPLRTFCGPFTGYDEPQVPFVLKEKQSPEPFTREGKPGPFKIYEKNEAQGVLQTKQETLIRKAKSEPFGNNANSIMTKIVHLDQEPFTREGKPGPCGPCTVSINLEQEPFTREGKPGPCGPCTVRNSTDIKRTTQEHFTGEEKLGPIPFTGKRDLTNIVQIKRNNYTPKRKLGTYGVCAKCIGNTSQTILQPFTREGKPGPFYYYYAKSQTIKISHTTKEPLATTSTISRINCTYMAQTTEKPYKREGKSDPLPFIPCENCANNIKYSSQEPFTCEGKPGPFGSYVKNEANNASCSNEEPYTREGKPGGRGISSTSNMTDTSKEAFNFIAEIKDMSSYEKTSANNKTTQPIFKSPLIDNRTSTYESYQSELKYNTFSRDKGEYCCCCIYNSSGHPSVVQTELKDINATNYGHFINSPQVMISCEHHQKDINLHSSCKYPKQTICDCAKPVIKKNKKEIEKKKLFSSVKPCCSRACQVDILPKLETKNESNCYGFGEKNKIENTCSPVTSEMVTPVIPEKPCYPRYETKERCHKNTFDSNCSCGKNMKSPATNNKKTTLSRSHKSQSFPEPEKLVGIISDEMKTELGYFETEFKEIVKISRYKTSDGAIADKKQIVTIKTEKKFPRKPDADETKITGNICPDYKSDKVRKNVSCSGAKKAGYEDKNETDITGNICPDYKSDKVRKNVSCSGAKKAGYEDKNETDITGNICPDYKSDKVRKNVSCSGYEDKNETDITGNICPDYKSDKVRKNVSCSGAKKAGYEDKNETDITGNICPDYKSDKVRKNVSCSGTKKAGYEDKNETDITGNICPDYKSDKDRKNVSCSGAKKEGDIDKNIESEKVLSCSKCDAKKVDVLFNTWKAGPDIELTITRASTPIECFSNIGFDCVEDSQSFCDEAMKKEGQMKEGNGCPTNMPKKACKSTNYMIFLALKPTPLITANMPLPKSLPKMTSNTDLYSGASAKVGRIIKACKRLWHHRHAPPKFDCDNDIAEIPKKCSKLMPKLSKMLDKVKNNNLEGKNTDLNKSDNTLLKKRILKNVNKSEKKDCIPNDPGRASAKSSIISPSRSSTEKDSNSNDPSRTLSESKGSNNVKIHDISRESDCKSLSIESSTCPCLRNYDISTTNSSDNTVPSYSSKKRNCHCSESILKSSSHIFKRLLSHSGSKCSYCRNLEDMAKNLNNEKPQSIKRSDTSLQMSISDHPNRPKHTDSGPKCTCTDDSPSLLRLKVKEQSDFMCYCQSKYVVTDSDPKCTCTLSQTSSRSQETYNSPKCSCQVSLSSQNSKTEVSDEQCICTFVKNNPPKMSSLEYVNRLKDKNGDPKCTCISNNVSKTSLVNVGELLQSKQNSTCQEQTLPESRGPEGIKRTENFKCSPKSSYSIKQLLKIVTIAVKDTRTDTQTPVVPNFPDLGYGATDILLDKLYCPLKHSASAIQESENNAQTLSAATLSKTLSHLQQSAPTNLSKKNCKSPVTATLSNTFDNLLKSERAALPNTFSNLQESATPALSNTLNDLQEPLSNTFNTLQEPTKATLPKTLSNLQDPTTTVLSYDNYNLQKLSEVISENVKSCSQNLSKLRDGPQDPTTVVLTENESPYFLAETDAKSLGLEDTEPSSTCGCQFKICSKANPLSSSNNDESSLSDFNFATDEQIFFPKITAQNNSNTNKKQTLSYLSDTPISPRNASIHIVSETKTSQRKPSTDNSTSDEFNSISNDEECYHNFKVDGVPKFDHAEEEQLLKITTLNASCPEIYNIKYYDQYTGIADLISRYKNKTLKPFFFTTNPRSKNSLKSFPLKTTNLECESSIKDNDSDSKSKIPVQNVTNLLCDNGLESNKKCSHQKVPLVEPFVALTDIKAHSLPWNKRRRVPDTVDVNVKFLVPGIEIKLNKLKKTTLTVSKSVKNEENKVYARSICRSHYNLSTSNDCVYISPKKIVFLKKSNYNDSVNDLAFKIHTCTSTTDLCTPSTKAMSPTVRSLWRIGFRNNKKHKFSSIRSIKLLRKPAKTQCCKKKDEDGLIIKSTLMGTLKKILGYEKICKSFSKAKPTKSAHLPRSALSRSLMNSRYVASQNNFKTTIDNYVTDSDSVSNKSIISSSQYVSQNTLIPVDIDNGMEATSDTIDTRYTKKVKKKFSKVM